MQRQGMKADVSWDRSAAQICRPLPIARCEKAGMTMTQDRRDHALSPTRSPAPPACARRCRSSSSRTMPRISSSRSSTALEGLRGQDAGDRRRRPLLQPRGHPDRHPHGRRQRLRQGDRRAGRHPVDAGRLATSSANTRPSAASSCRPATIPAARTRISASSTISAMAARRRRRSPTRSSRAPRRSPATGSPMSARVDLDTIGTVEAGGMTVEVIDPVADYAELMESLFDFDAIRGDVQVGLPHALRRHARGDRALCQGDPREPARRAEGHGAQLRAAAGFRRPSSRPEPGPRQGPLRRDDGHRTRRISAPPPTATATAT